MGQKRSADKVLVGKFKSKKSLGKPRCRWDSNIKTDLKEIGWEGVDWTHLAQDRDFWWAHLNMVKNLCGS
jgi:hypothetical protein